MSGAFSFRADRKSDFTSVPDFNTSKARRWQQARRADQDGDCGAAEVQCVAECSALF
jgi:hypothetical protein